MTPDLWQIAIDTVGTPTVLLIIVLCIFVLAELAVLICADMRASDDLPPPPGPRNLHTGNTPAPRPSRRVRAGQPPPLKPSYDSRRHAQSASGQSPQA